MWDLSQYMSDDLAFIGFLQGLLKGGTQVFRIVLKIFYRFSSVYLVTKSSEGLTAEEITEALSWLDSGKDEDPESLLEVRSLRGHLRL